MRVYIAGPWAKKELMHGAHAFVARRLRGAAKVVSTWTTQEEREYTDAELQALAERDWAELRSADTLILCGFKVKSEGKAVEMGAALALGMRVILVGTGLNIFCRLPQVEHVKTLGAAVALLQP